jgi:hypothetical protein
MNLQEAHNPQHDEFVPSPRPYGERVRVRGSIRIERGCGWATEAQSIERARLLHSPNQRLPLTQHTLAPSRRTLSP